MTRRSRDRLAAAAVLVVVLPLAVLARVGWTPLADADRHADVDTHTLVLRHRWLLDAARALTHLGDPLVVDLVVLVLAVLCWLMHRRRAALYLVAVRVAALVIGTGLKELIRRARPSLPDPVAVASGFSFPSGHALGSAALYGCVAVVMSARLPVVVRVLVAVVPPVVVAATRVLLGVHFPSDVVAGLVLGWSIALVAAVLVEEAS